MKRKLEEEAQSSIEASEQEEQSSREELEQEKCLQQQILDEILEDTKSKALEKITLLQELSDDEKKVDSETQRKLDSTLHEICDKDIDAALYAANIVACFHHTKNKLGGPTIESICKEKIKEHIEANAKGDHSQLESAAKAYALLLLTGDHNLPAYISDTIYENAQDLLEVNIKELGETAYQIQASAYPHLTDQLDRAYSSHTRELGL